MPITMLKLTVFKSCFGMCISSEQLITLMAVLRRVSSRRAIVPANKCLRSNNGTVTLRFKINIGDLLA